MCAHETYGYSETLAIVETLMIESGIRKFCSKTCKGYCCDACYKKSNACHKNEGRRLSCSIFLCHGLLGTIFTPCDHEVYARAYIKIKGNLRLIMKSSIFYTVHTKSIQDSFKINKYIVDPMKDIDTEKIKTALKKLGKL